MLFFVPMKFVAQIKEKTGRMHIEKFTARN